MRGLSRLAEKPLWETYLDDMWAKVSDTQMWIDASIVAGRIILIIVLSRLGLWLLGRVIDHVMVERDTVRLKLRTRRVQTVGRLLKNAASYTVHFIALLLILGNSILIWDRLSPGRE
ncbi:hypothetical protein [Cohnella faecalis]|uniref:hypothetical protein n=1 Tax=Cohnella faecalis TaxID=2315694 RepID=UPI001F21D9AE|nr:hypothetical protein [Cohnella faecalis]